MRRYACLILGSLAACTGAIGESSPTAGPGPSDPGPGPSTDGGVRPPQPPPPFEPVPGTLRRLTRREYTASVQELLGPGLAWPSDLEVDTTLFGFTTVGAASLSIGPRAAEQYEAAAMSLAQQVFADEARRSSFVGCTPSSATDPCVRAFLERFGQRAFRRPLTSDELDRWAQVVVDVDASLRSVWTALELTTAGLLQSPYFLHRVELGEPDPTTPDRLRYSGYEMASRLSYFLWGSTPDDALLAAAARGELDDRAGIEVAARRLLDDPRATIALRNFFSEHLKLDRLEGLSKDLGTFPQFTTTLGATMKEEILRLIDKEVLADGADFRGLFTSRTAFINDELARVYYLPSSGPTMIETSMPANSPRQGVLTTAGFLALNAHETVTSPTYRGRYIRQSLLCQDIPPPPANVNTNLPEPDPTIGPQTMRQRLETLHLEQATCAGCHLRMDPLGFGLEGFDAIGAYRTTDNGLPVDTRGSLDGQPFADAAELSRLISEHRALAPCITKMTYRYATGHVDAPSEEASLRAITEPFVMSGYRYRALALGITTSDGFRYAKVPE
jgi:hypothetical protein